MTIKDQLITYKVVIDQLVTDCQTNKKIRFDQGGSSAKRDLKITAFQTRILLTSEERAAVLPTRLSRRNLWRIIVSISRKMKVGVVLRQSALG